jgi:Ca2+-binding EF-hand superfamily protein
MIFSKKFFNIMDDDGTGGIELEELAQPLIALGLATDTGFVKRSLKVLNPKKFGTGCFDQALTLKEFARIFRTDPISDKLMNLIKEDLDQSYVHV